MVKGGLAAEPVCILVADASRIGCQLLATALGRSRYKFNVVASAVNSAEVLAALKKHEPEFAALPSPTEFGELPAPRQRRGVGRGACLYSCR